MCSAASSRLDLVVTGDGRYNAPTHLHNHHVMHQPAFIQNICRGQIELTGAPWGRENDADKSAPRASAKQSG